MSKIQKNKSDREMFRGFEEELEIASSPKTSPAEQKLSNNTTNLGSFFSDVLQEQVGKALLELKIKLFNQGIVDFDFKVKTVDNDIVIRAVPKSKK